MKLKNFKAMIVEEQSDNTFTRRIGMRKTDSLPGGEVLIEVHFSALNYKDALSARGHKGISRNYPHTPGIDASGIVADSSSHEFSEGQQVLVTGYDLGMNTSGGFAEYIRVPAAWVVPMPQGLDLRSSMIYGTAGFTAGICINELQNHDILPGKATVLITGATGGVGSLGLGMLKKAGYNVIASTGKADRHDFLKRLGADEILGREAVDDKTGRPLLKGLWDGAIENVGGNTLSTAIRGARHRGAVCCLGNVSGDMLSTSVYPFLLRGITLIGIDSASRPMDYRLNVWKRLSTEWAIDDLEWMVKEVTLEELDREIDIILKGGQCGKVIVRVK